MFDVMCMCVLFSSLLTALKWFWILLRASFVSCILCSNASFTALNWFHMSCAVSLSTLSAMFMYSSDWARSLAERRMFSSVKRAHDSGVDTLLEIIRFRRICTFRNFTFSTVKTFFLTCCRHFQYQRGNSSLDWLDSYDEQPNRLTKL